MPNIKEIINQLNSIDVKSIDFSRINEEVFQRKDILVNAGVILLSVYFLFNIMGDRKDNISAHQEEIEVLQRKVSVVEELENTKGKIHQLLNSVSVGPSDVSSLINLINDFAIKHKVQILSFVPSGAEQTEYFEKINLDLSIASDSYANIGSFVYDIETSNKNLRIETWSVGGGATRRRGRWTQASQGKQEGDIQVSLRIASVNLNKEKQR